MVIEINAEWAQKKEEMSQADLDAYNSKYRNHDELLWHRKMEGLRLGTARLCLQRLIRLYRLKFPKDWDDGDHGCEQVLKRCNAMSQRIKKNGDPEDKAYLESIAFLLKKLPSLRRELRLPKRIPAV